MLNLFKSPEKSKWIDVGTCNINSNHKLIQMRFRLDNNKKEFRTVNLGFINSTESFINLSTNIMKHNAN